MNMLEARGSVTTNRGQVTIGAGTTDSLDMEVDVRTIGRVAVAVAVTVATIKVEVVVTTTKVVMAVDHREVTTKEATTNHRTIHTVVTTAAVAVVTDNSHRTAAIKEAVTVETTVTTTNRMVPIVTTNRKGGAITSTQTRDRVNSSGDNGVGTTIVTAVTAATTEVAADIVTRLSACSLLLITC